MADRGIEPPDLEARLRAVERLTILFRAERIVYLCFAVAAFVLLLGCVGATLLQANKDAFAVLGAFGASGVVTYTSSRALVMWSRAIRLVTSWDATSRDSDR